MKREQIRSRCQSQTAAPQSRFTNGKHSKEPQKVCFEVQAYEVGYILRGLRLEVDGGNADGSIVADKIRFGGRT